ncbi:MAG: ankyrin repeat domain-containing protein [Paracoccaceae bacterium]|nr:ankyrin repeat domain-containing protein [Paracoccaceae bacterium]
MLIWLFNAAQQNSNRSSGDRTYTPTSQTPVIGSQPSPTRNPPLNRTPVQTEQETTGNVVRGNPATGQGLTQGDKAQSLNPGVPDDELTAGECGRWCDVSFWKTATVADLQADIAAGANVHARTEDGATPLHWAAALNVDEAMIMVLVEAGADVHARTDDGVTPLHGAAALNANPDVITVLLRSGADLKAKDSSSKTPFDYIRENEKLKDWEAYWRLNYLQPQ